MWVKCRNDVKYPTNIYNRYKHLEIHSLSDIYIYYIVDIEDIYSRFSLHFEEHDGIYTCDGPEADSYELYEEGALNKYVYDKIFISIFKNSYKTIISIYTLIFHSKLVASD